MKRTKKPKKLSLAKLALYRDQLTFTEAIIVCEGVAKRGDRTLTRGAKACADMLTQVRDAHARKAGL